MFVKGEVAAPVVDGCRLPECDGEAKDMLSRKLRDIVAPVLAPPRWDQGVLESDCIEGSLRKCWGEGGRDEEAAEPAGLEKADCWPRAYSYLHSKP